jgi:hypothetical protein
VSGGLQAVEGLRLVLAELHAVTLRDTVSFAMGMMRFSDDGKLTDADPKPAEVAMNGMLTRLNWWATSLPAQRAKTPYSTSPPKSPWSCQTQQ